MATAYYEFSREEFEKEIKAIADKRGVLVGDFTNKSGQKAERIYEMTTSNPKVRLAIYSSIGINGRLAADVGGDAVRILAYVSRNGKYFYKKFKKHQRIGTIFKNIEKSVITANNEFVHSDEVKKWLYAVGKNN